MDTKTMQKRFDEFNELYFDNKIDHYQVKAVKPRVNWAVTWYRNRKTILIDNNCTPETVDYLLLQAMCNIYGDNINIYYQANMVEKRSHGKYFANKILHPPLVMEGDNTLKVIYGAYINRDKLKSGKEITTRNIEIDVMGKGCYGISLLFTVEGKIGYKEMKMRSEKFAESLLDKIDTRHFIESIRSNVMNEEGFVIGLK